MSLYNATDRAEAFEGMHFNTWFVLLVVLMLTGTLLFACRNREERNPQGHRDAALVQEQAE